MIPAGNLWAGTGGCPRANGGVLGGRGSRSDSAAVRRIPDRPVPSLAPIIVASAPQPHPLGASMATFAGLAVSALIVRALFGGGLGLGVPLDLVLGGSAVLVVLMFLRRRLATRAQPWRADTPSERPTTADHPTGGSSFDGGVRDIRRTDPGFDPARFTGYTGMVFRDAQRAWMTRDIDSLRDRTTPEMYGELQAQSDRLRGDGQANRLEQIDITAAITEAWQEAGRDYVTASIGGSIIDYTVDEVADSLVHGSRTIPRHIEEFWTFTRPAGLNFWMLSAIRSS